MGIEVVTMKEHLQLVERLERLEYEVNLQGVVLNHIGWIPALQVMAMGFTGLTTWKGINAAEARGELVLDRTKKKHQVSIKSLITCIRKRGYTAEYLQTKLSA